jgi:hypothetical protein
MTDLELCKNKDYFGIFTKYEMMFYKVWDSLSPTLKFQIWPEEGDFFSFCYEKTVMAVDSIKPEKVKKPDTWTIYIQLYRYIKTYAEREIQKEYHNNACSLDSFIEDNDFDENAALKYEEYPKVDMSMFTKEEKEFIEYMQNHTTYKGKYTQYAYRQFKKSITAKLLN